VNGSTLQFSPVDLDALAVGVVLLNREWRAVLVNRAARERLGMDGAGAAGPTLRHFFEAGDALEERLRARLEANGRATESSVRVSRPTRITTVDVHAERLRSGDVLLTLVEADARLAQQAEIERMQRALAEAEKHRTRMDAVQKELNEAAFEPPRIIGRSAAILQMLDRVERVAPSSATVLIHGESGSGKELVARAIHAGSARSRRGAGGPLVAVNCAALPENLIESELFGHERGAFTGADRQRLGKFEVADGGTLFLDEIAELSLQAQAKLLRVLQDGTFERVGGSEPIRVDVRVIAATHRDLAQQVERGRFREDLFYRLNVFRIEVPPLRSRQEDIRELAEFFHARHAARLARPRLPISERSMRRLLAYRWPGNVRELENAVERATLLCTEDATELEIELPESPAPGRGGATGASTGARDTSNVPRDVLLDLSLDQLQRLQIMHALETRNYRVFGKDGAAEKLGMNPQTLLSRMDKLGIPRPRAMRKFMKNGGAEPRI